MNFRGRRHRQRGVAVEITPMIDVVFLLIIFFMTTAQFAKLTRAEVELPREPGEQESEPREAGLVINITREGGLVVSGRPLEPDELGEVIDAELRRGGDAAARLRLLIRADRAAPAERLNRVVELLESKGVATARLATEVPR